MASAESKDAEGSVRWLVFGRTGWIGGMVLEQLSAVAGYEVIAAASRLDNLKQVEEELDSVKPDRVVNCAGLTGRPNVDWCEDHKDEVLRVNVIGTLALVSACASRGIHVTNYATGCIYSYDEKHPIGGPGFTEEDTPNFTGSWYSLTKGMVEKMMSAYSNVLILRLRMPISDDLHARSFVTKITKYRRVVNIPNSMTVLHDLIPVSLDLAKRKEVGVLNFTNPGAISHNEILDLYKEVMDKDFWYENFTEEEQSKVLKAARSNNTLDTTKLEALAGGPIPHIKDSVRRVFERMAAAAKAAGKYPPPPAKPPRDP